MREIPTKEVAGMPVLELKVLNFFTDEIVEEVNLVEAMLHCDLF